MPYPPVVVGPLETWAPMDLLLGQTKLSLETLRPRGGSFRQWRLRNVRVCGTCAVRAQGSMVLVSEVEFCPSWYCLSPAGSQPSSGFHIYGCSLERPAAGGHAGCGFRELICVLYNCMFFVSFYLSFKCREILGHLFFVSEVPAFKSMGLLSPMPQVLGLRGRPSVHRLPFLVTRTLGLYVRLSPQARGTTGQCFSVTNTLECTVGLNSVLQLSTFTIANEYVSRKIVTLVDQMNSCAERRTSLSLRLWCTCAVHQSMKPLNTRSSKK